MDIQQALTEAANAAITSPELVEATKAAEAPQEPAEPQEEVVAEDAAHEPEESEPQTSEEATDEPQQDLPEGYVAVPVVEDKLATEFVLKDAEGEVEIPALIVEYKANGKVRQDRLDQVVKLAQFGVYNEAREQQYKQVEQEVQVIQQEREELARLVEEREAQLERILSDEDFFLSVRDAYQAENSPERRAERAEREIENIKIQSQVSEISRQGQAFYESEVKPAIELIANALPSVAPEEL
jgi:hypothetical protein